MATGHWITNRGKKWLIDGGWTDTGAGELRMGYLSVSQPAALDTETEVNAIDTVSGLLAAGATEATFTNYARQTLTRGTATEDDTNDRVNMDISDVTIASAGGATNNTLYGAFFYTEGGGTDGTRELISVDWFASTITTNGGNLTYAVTDLYRAT
jgi:hypothetical protein